MIELSEEVTCAQGDDGAFLFPRAAITEKDLHHSSVKFLAALYRHHDLQTPFKDGIRHMSDYSGLSVPTIHKHCLPELEKSGYLRINRCQGVPGNRYALPARDDYIYLDLAEDFFLLKHVTPSMFRVYLFLIAHTQAGSAEISLREFKCELGVDNSNISRHIKDLESLGLIRVERTAWRGQYNRYTVINGILKFQELEEQDNSSSPRKPPR